MQPALTGLFTRHRLPVRSLFLCSVGLCSVGLCSLGLWSCSSEQSSPRTASSSTEPENEPAKLEESPSSDGTESSTRSEDIPAESPTQEPPAPNEELSDAEAEALAAIEASAPQDSQQPEREILYRVTPQGLHVEIEGADFVPTAEAVRVGGGWGLVLSAEATADAPLVLYSPKEGPLAFGGKVQRKSGRIESFGDTREGGKNLSLGPDSPQSFSKKWPIAGVSPLAVGEELELHVGLWGLGTSSEDRRPVRKFVTVKMRAGPNGAQPIIEPPPQ